MQNDPQVQVITDNTEEPPQEHKLQEIETKLPEEHPADHPEVQPNEKSGEQLNE